jgi:hypothetical protein
MLYHNPEIVRNGGDLRIAGFRVEEGEELSYLDVIARTKNRIQRLVGDYVRSQMADGVTHEQAIENTRRLIYSYLTIDDKMYALTESEIVEELANSFEFSTWETSIYYRFMNIHKDKIGEDTPQPVGGKFNPTISEEMVMEVQQDDNLWLVLEGLVAETIVK